MDAPRDREGLSFLPAAAAHDPWPAVAGDAAMKILERLGKRSSREQASAPDSAEASSKVSTGRARAREDKAALVQAGIRPDPPPTRTDPDRPPAMKTKSHHSHFDRVDVARDERNERERLRDEARYRRERLELYRARLYGGRAASQGKLRELQRASDGAAARLRRAEAAAIPTHPPI
jgi:hypothetical protein